MSIREKLLELYNEPKPKLVFLNGVGEDFYEYDFAILGVWNFINSKGEEEPKVAYSERLILSLLLHQMKDPEEARSWYSSEIYRRSQSLKEIIILEGE